MTTPSVGQDISDSCNRCGDTWHVVMAKVGDRVVKVVCKLCGAQHNYQNERANAASSSGKKTFKRRTNTAAPPPAAPIVTDPSQPPRDYSPRDAYLPGERIAHPKFGVGVVRSTPGPGKVDVVFSSGDRVLACAKDGTGLERHTPVISIFADRPPDGTEK